MATSGLMMHLVVCLLGICITILRNITCYFRYSLNFNAIVQETIVSDREMFPSVLRNNYQPVGDGWMSLGQGDTFVVISASLFNCFSFIQIIRNFSISSRVGDVFFIAITPLATSTPFTNFVFPVWYRWAISSCHTAKQDPSHKCNFHSFLRSLSSPLL